MSEDHTTINKMLEQIRDNTLQGLKNNEKHYIEDDVRFGEILKNQQKDKDLHEKYVEQQKITGEHFSEFRLEIVEGLKKVKDHLKQQDEKLELIDQRFEELKPLLKEVDFYKTLWGKIMEGLKKLSVVSGAIVAWYVIRDFFAK